MSSDWSVKMVWDNVPEPGPEPPRPASEGPPAGSEGHAEYVQACRAHDDWLRRARRHVLARAVEDLDGTGTPEERLARIERAVKVAGCMILAGEVGPEPFTSLMHMF